MLPITSIQPWMIKVGAVVLFLSAVFIGGCRVQKQMDKAKIQRLEADYARAVEIIEVFQDNYDALDKALKDQNEAIADLGKRHLEKVAAIERANQKSLDRLARRNSEALREAESEAAKLRERMAELSVAEACHEAWLEVAQ